MYKTKIEKLWDILASRFYKLEDAEVIILGNQKSGTTAIAKLLALATRKSCLLDTPLLWEPNFSQLKQGNLSLSKLINQHKYFFSKSIIKEPGLTFLFDQLKGIYPASIQYVFIVRDPRDNIRSILNRLSIPGHLDILNPAKHTLNANEKTYFDANLFGYQESHYVAQLAERWNQATQLYLANTTGFRLVKYETFQADKATFIYELSKSLGMEVCSDISKKVDYPFQSQGDSTIGHLAFFGKRNLDMINTICKASMIKLSYSQV